MNTAKKIGDYLIYAKLGTDYTSDVWLGRLALVKDAWAAIKVLKLEKQGDPVRIARFLTEIKAHGMSQSIDTWGVNVARVCHAGEHDQKMYYLAIEYIRGLHFEQLVRSAPFHRLVPGIACELVRQAALGAAFLHSLRWVHRDIKPRNIMLTSTGVVKLIDLGSVLISPDSTITTDEAICGSPAYVSPLQIENAHQVNDKADVYSLALVLYYLMTGTDAFHPPIMWNSKKELLDFRREHRPNFNRDLANCNSALKLLLENVLDDPTGSHMSANQLAIELAEHAANKGDFQKWVEDLSVPPPSFPDHPLPNDTEQDPDPHSALFPGYLHFYSTGFHNVSDDVPRIISGKGNYRVIPTKYLFAHSQSFALYKKLLDQPDYTIHASGQLLFRKNCSILAEKIHDHFHPLVSNNTSKQISIVSLGIGSGEKEKFLIQELLKKNLRPTLFILDINPTFIHSFFVRKREISKACKCQFILGDFDHIQDFGNSLPNLPAIFLALGGTFGNQREGVLLKHLRSATKAPALLLFDFQTKASLRDHALAGYDTEANKQFIQSSVQALSNETIGLDKIKAVIDSAHPSLRELRLSDMDTAETLVMLAETHDASLLVGYSSRYDLKDLNKFLSKLRIKILHSANDINTHTYIKLCSI